MPDDMLNVVAGAIWLYSFRLPQHHFSIKRLPRKQISPQGGSGAGRTQGEWAAGQEKAAWAIATTSNEQAAACSKMAQAIF